MRLAGALIAATAISALSLTSAYAAPPPACYADWSATTVYNGGDQVSEYGVNYTANYYTQNQDPMTNSGQAGDPWTQTGICHACEVAPSTPTQLTDVATNDTQTDLIWSQPAVPANCTVSGYHVYRNSRLIGSTAGNNFSPSGLRPSTRYRFTVSAFDSVGASEQSPPHVVKTMATHGGGPVPVFAPYIDMSQQASDSLPGIMRRAGLKDVTLAFVLSPGDCSAAWGGTVPVDNDVLSNGKTIRSLIQRVRANGGDVIISFGGAAGQEPALVCTDVASLRRVYQHVIKRYAATAVDFDIEGGSLTNQASLDRRDLALRAIKRANPGLTISYTLPVLPTGLDGGGVHVLDNAKKNRFRPDVINIMAMDYGALADSDAGMGHDALTAANNTALQIKNAGLTSLVGVTPMIGVNDVNTEVFSLGNARQVLAFAQGNPDIARLAMWSLNRDNGNCAGAQYADATCSGLRQRLYGFSKTFNVFGP